VKAQRFEFPAPKAKKTAAKKARKKTAVLA
jgi:hypothetical protein